MKFALTLGVALAAVTLAASAHTSHSRTVIRHGGGVEINFDADNDGWLSRAEATTAADRLFDHMDGNDDGRLTSEDHRALEDIHVRVDAPRAHEFELDGEDGERRVIIRRGGELTEEEEARIEREVERAMEHAERAREGAERGARQAERAAHDAERRTHRLAHDAERSSTREVIIIRADGDDHHAVAPTAPTPPVPPVPPRPPMFMMLIANSEEADLNGDSAISREEFRAQHLRFFDASDANGDGRIRFEAPPAPPTPPTPPAPPAPPRQR
ncbi:MAG: hypothetical protein H7124_13750 [Phycisphaerales bacterium]|nr:hypothetical protein [Hyphomonadaceae bacterium]